VVWEKTLPPSEVGGKSVDFRLYKFSFFSGQRRED
jgi:hypothetical protein